MGAGELSEKPDEMLGETCDGLASHPGGLVILLVASYLSRNRYKLRQSWANWLARLNLYYSNMNRKNVVATSILGPAIRSVHTESGKLLVPRRFRGLSRPHLTWR